MVQCGEELFWAKIVDGRLELVEKFAEFFCIFGRVACRRSLELLHDFVGVCKEARFDAGEELDVV